MKRFYCQCNQEIFFNNAFCDKCGRDLIYDPEGQTMWSGELTEQTFLTHPYHSQSDQPPILLQPCSNRSSSILCNWSVSDNESNQCISCRTTQVIPDLSIPKNNERWLILERAKRQLVSSLINLNLPLDNYHQHKNGLAFHFLEDQRSNPAVGIEHVLTGYSNGVITLNAAEADEGFLHTMKEQMGESYRTILGHFRHEIGHYYWHKLIHTEQQLNAFRELFGDEREDYAEALEYYYQHDKSMFKSSQYITPYASSHPYEDWAETWAHYLHIVDTLETAMSYGLSAYEPKINDFNVWFAEWARVAQIMNALNRSMGLSDAYPFILTDIVRMKLQFIDSLLDEFSS